MVHVLVLILHVYYVQQDLQVPMYVNYVKKVIDGIIMNVIVIYRIVNNVEKIHV